VTVSRPSADRPEDVDVLATPEAGNLVIRGGTIRVVGYGLSILVSVASAPFLIRHLGVAEYGRFVTVMSLIMILASITDAGLSTVGLREYAVREASERHALMRQLLGLRMLLTVVGAVVVGAVVAAGKSHQVPVGGFMIAAVGLLLLVIQHTAAIPLSSELRLGLITALDFVRNVLATALTLVFVVLGRGLLAFLFVPVPVGLAILLLTLVAAGTRMPLRPAIDVAFARRLLRDTLPYAAATAVGVIFYRVGIVLLSLVSTQAQVGYFSASFRVTETLAAIPALLATSAFPVVARAARENSERLAYALQRMFEVSVIVGLWFVFGTIIAAHPAIYLVAGGAFSPSVRVLQIQGAALLATFLVGTWGFALLGLRRHGALLVANLIALAAGAAATVVLGRDHGAEGAAIGLTCVEYGLAAMYAVALMRTRPDLRVSLRVLPRALLAAAVASAVVLTGLPRFVDLLVATVVYFAVLSVLRAIPEELGAAFRLARRAG
jgi:O-antigen/teichoic acid export membrane protein